MLHRYLERCVEDGSGRGQPTDITVAFALALVKSKPANSTIKDYILSLRNHVSMRNDGLSSSMPVRLIDAKSYWRARDAQARCQLERVQSETFELRLEVEALKAASKSSRTTDQKRKHQVSDAASQPSAKKGRQEASLHPNLSATSQNLSETYHSAPLSVLLPDLFRLQMISQSQDKPKTIEVSYYITRASERLIQVLRDVLAPHLEDESRGTNSGGIRGCKEDFIAFSRAFATLITCCKSIGQLSDATAVQAKAIYAIVQVFKQITHSIRDVSRQLAARVVEQDAQHNSVGRYTRSKAKLHGKSSGKGALEAADVVHALATLSGDTFDILDPENAIHKGLFEGFACCALSRLGDHLYAVVFGHERGPTLESEIDRVGATQGKRYGDGIASLDAYIKLEAPCWVHLLKRVMSSASRFLDIPPRQNVRASETDDQAPRKGDLASSALVCLQQTLVNGIMGVESHNQSQSFVDCLRMPLPDDTQISVPDANDINIKEWLKGEVWGVLGWEILSRESFGQVG